MSSFLQSIVTDVAPVLLGLGKTKTAQSIAQYTLDVILAVEFKQTSFDVGEYTVKVSLNGSPVGLDLGDAFKAIALIEAGRTGTFQSGDVVLSIEPKQAA